MLGSSGASAADCVRFDVPEARAKPATMTQTAMIRMYQSRSLARIAARMAPPPSGAPRNKDPLLS